jgi:hypothetical protein
MTEDETEFGKNSWVYCNQHRRPHSTGWCTVDNSNKVKLEATNLIDARAECNRRGFPLLERHHVDSHK